MWQLEGYQVLLSIGPTCRNCKEDFCSHSAADQEQCGYKNWKIMHKPDIPDTDNYSSHFL